ncbi:serine/threonine-protein kinase STN8, chloroplastic [Trifolium repens]|nr:serine/threonine-protein kinase STN8, chloroplastic [Trifolium repens]
MFPTAPFWIQTYYCPPELYVLPEETPSPPPAPIAAFFSPILLQLNSPDLFDMYSAGIVLLHQTCSYFSI